MVKRLYIKSGDIFSVNLDNKISRYFQYLLIDPCQLNSEVIRVFNYQGITSDLIDFNELIKSGIDFYSHVVIRWGIQMGLWNKFGYIPLEEGFDPPFFRDVFGNEDEIIDGKIQFNKTDKWQIWQAGQPFSSRKNVGWLSEEYQKIDLGLVWSPQNLMSKLQTGSFDQPYYT